MVKQSPTLIQLRHAKTFLCESLVIGTYRTQVGTNLERNGTSLCMEELGDGFSFVFVLLWCFWMLFDPCPRNLML